jgi:hypothetical protein
MKLLENLRLFKIAHKGKQVDVSQAGLDGKLGHGHDLPKLPLPRALVPLPRATYVAHSRV